MLQHGRTPLPDLNPVGDDPQRRRASRTSPPSRPASPACTAPRSSSRAPGRWTYEIDDGFISEPAAHVSGGADRRAARAATATAAATDDGGPNLLWLIPGIALLLAAARAADRAPRLARHGTATAGGVRATILAAGGLACAGAAMTIAAFAGGGRRPRTPPRAPRPGQATGVTAGPQVFAEQGCGSLPHVRARQRPRRRSAPTSRSRSTASRATTCCESIVAPERGVAAERTRRRDADDFAQRIAPEDLDPLVAYLMKGALGRPVACSTTSTIRVSDRAASERFYDTVLTVLGTERTPRDDGFAEWGDFSIVADGRPGDAAPAHRLLRPAHELVDAFHRAGVEAGFASDGEPGPRPSTRPSTTARSCWTPTATASRPSHSRTSASSARSTICGCASPTSPPARASTRRSRPVVGLRGRGGTRPSTPQLAADGGSFSFIAGDEPTENVHIAFAAATTRPSTPSTPPPTGAGYRDNGAPGERADLPPRLLRRVRARPRRPQHRGRQSQPLSSARPAAISGVVDEVVHALEDVERHRPRRAPTAPPRSRAPATPAPSRPGRDVPEIDRRLLEGAEPRRDRPARPAEPARVEQQPAVAARDGAARTPPPGTRPARTRRARPARGRRASAAARRPRPAPSSATARSRRTAPGTTPATSCCRPRRARPTPRRRVADPLGERQHVVRAAARARAAARRRRGRPRRTARAAAPVGPRGSHEGANHAAPRVSAASAASTSEE